MITKKNEPFVVTIFEDTSSVYSGVESMLTQLKKELNFEFRRYESSKTNVNSHAEVEKLVKESSLVLMDYDLTKYEPTVSRPLIVGVCDELGIPLVLYHFVVEEMERITYMRDWGEDIIVLQDYKTILNLSKKLSAFIRGFIQIRNGLLTAGKQEFIFTINDILESPEGSEVAINQYLWSRFSPLQIADIEPTRATTRRTAALGYWIYNVLLQFPGVLLNETAAASYLDIFLDDFSKDGTQDVFKDALYNGPFSGGESYWWLKKLDELLLSSAEKLGEVKTGHDLLEKLGKNVRRSRCYHDHDGAGFYCIIRQTAVCSKHSANPGEWLPLGAERSRIEIDKFEELKPWIQL